MNFTIKKEKLLKVLNVADKAISQIVPFPYLKGILIIIKESLITFITSDSHISIKTTLTDSKDFIVKEEGKILLDEKMISEISKKIEADEITFDSIENDLIAVYGGNSKYKLNVLSFENFPEIDFGSINKKFKVNSCILKTIVEKTAFACSEKEIQLNLTGINLFSKEGKLHALATDRFKLSSKEFEINLDQDFNIIIPKKYFISALLAINQNEVELEIQNNKLLFHTDETIVQVELIEDLFPDITPVFNNTIEGELTINKNTLLKMIDRCSLIKDEKNKTALSLKIENNKLFLSSRNNISSSSEELELSNYIGENLNIVYDSKFLMDSLKVLDTEEINIEFTKEKKVAILKNKDDSSLILVISPQKG